MQEYTKHHVLLKSQKLVIKTETRTLLRIVVKMKDVSCINICCTNEFGESTYTLVQKY